MIVLIGIIITHPESPTKGFTPEIGSGVFTSLVFIMVFFGGKWRIHSKLLITIPNMTLLSAYLKRLSSYINSLDMRRLIMILSAEIYKKNKRDQQIKLNCHENPVFNCFNSHLHSSYVQFVFLLIFFLLFLLLSHRVLL